jgi:hypothetical protein
MLQMQHLLDIGVAEAASQRCTPRTSDVTSSYIYIDVPDATPTYLDIDIHLDIDVYISI